MRSFEEILDIAAARKGGRDAVLGGIEPPKEVEDLAAIADDRWLAAMTRGVFQAGISWTVVDKKWPGIEEAFHGFEIARCAFMPPDWFDELIADSRIIRSPPKLRAVQENAAFIQKVSAETGSFGRRVGDWPGSDFVGLLAWLKKNGARLGGSTGSYMLRAMGKDGFILSQDVTARLIAEGVIDKPASSQKSLAAVQAAFDVWAAQSGLPLKVISRVLAQSL